MTEILHRAKMAAHLLLVPLQKYDPMDQYETTTKTKKQGFWQEKKKGLLKGIW